MLTRPPVIINIIHHPAAHSEAFSLKSPLIKDLIISLSHPLHSIACPVLLVITFPTHMYSDKFTRLLLQKHDAIYGWTLANSQPSVGLKVVRLIIIILAIYFLKILVWKGSSFKYFMEILIRPKPHWPHRLRRLCVGQVFKLIYMYLR